MNDCTPGAPYHPPDTLTQSDMDDFLDLARRYSKIRRRLRRMRHKLIQRLSGGAGVEQGPLTAMAIDPYDHPWDALRELDDGDWDRLAELVGGELAEHLESKVNRPGQPFLMIGVLEDPNDPVSIDALYTG